MLILNNDEIESLISVEASLRFLEKAYSQQAEGKAVYRPRTDLYLPKTTDSGVYAFKSMEGGLTDPPVVALRLNSDVIRWEEREGRTIKRKIPQGGSGKWAGIILLFSAETGEPLAIFPDGVIQRWRVAGTSALAARYLARENAATLGLFGSGWQAGAHVPMMCGIRTIKRIRLYSPTKANGERFAEEMEKKVRVAVEVVERPEEVADGADILVAATNAIPRVIEPGWLRPGVHVTCVKDCELGEETIRRADRLAIHCRRFAPRNYIAGFGDEEIEAHDPVDFLKQGGGAVPPLEPPFWVSAPELKDLVSGRVPGRKSEREITCFINNIGIGLQFAALGACVYADAKSKGIGRELPTDWFLESVHP